MIAYAMGDYKYAYGEYSTDMNRGYLLKGEEAKRAQAISKAENKAYIEMLKAHFYKKYQGKF